MGFSFESQPDEQTDQKIHASTNYGQPEAIGLCHHCVLTLVLLYRPFNIRCNKTSKKPHFCLISSDRSSRSFLVKLSRPLFQVSRGSDLGNLPYFSFLYNHFILFLKHELLHLRPGELQSSSNNKGSALNQRKYTVLGQIRRKVNLLQSMFQP